MFLMVRLALSLDFEILPLIYRNSCIRSLNYVFYSLWKQV